MNSKIKMIFILKNFLTKIKFYKLISILNKIRNFQIFSLGIYNKDESFELKISISHLQLFGYSPRF